MDETPQGDATGPAVDQVSPVTEVEPAPAQTPAPAIASEPALPAIAAAPPIVAPVATYVAERVDAPRPPSRLRWDGWGRMLALLLSGATLFCAAGSVRFPEEARILLIGGFVPAVGLLFLLADASASSEDQRLARAVIIGAFAGFEATLVTSIFCVPFAYPELLKIQNYVPYLPLFASIPETGARVLGSHYGSIHSPAAIVLGWLYVFGSGAVCGILYVALAREPARRRRAGAVLFAAVLGGAIFLLFWSKSVFGLDPKMKLFAVPIAMCLIFGIALGRVSSNLARRWPPFVPTLPSISASLRAPASNSTL